ncbi:4Fe-4S ferredoxin, iron-sulfur binding domain protein [Candidatus Desulforudis audaxviator MP104C]|uniref:4Fe-4S ferredoxin, iron-sulfur binding domain protein n=2 Tax=Candidatus Desulforudis TaxID=471826 RepID=B1I628_DESAP|nr:4Fe-4S ferredoxin, iron-sulfur binding domain protein [Candidatus Desulforudis audaxviator MP104C]
MEGAMAHVTGLNVVHLRRRLETAGACLVGFADLTGLLPPGLQPYPRAVSIALRLPDEVAREIVAGPTPAYLRFYRRANEKLDELAGLAAQHLRRAGGRALVVPASVRASAEELRGLFPHKTAATRAGLGWIGKNALLITPAYGPRVRLVTVLTDLNLSAGSPFKASRCGRCTECVDACPTRALTGTAWKAGLPRGALLDTTRCREAVERAGRSPVLPVCGVCVGVCPQGHRDRNAT